MTADERVTDRYGHELVPVVVCTAYVGSGRYRVDEATGMWWAREMPGSYAWRIYHRPDMEYAFSVHPCRVIGTDAWWADRGKEDCERIERREQRAAMGPPVVIDGDSRWWT